MRRLLIFLGAFALLTLLRLPPSQVSEIEAPLCSERPAILRSLSALQVRSSRLMLPGTQCDSRVLQLRLPAKEPPTRAPAPWTGVPIKKIEAATLFLGERIPNPPC